MYIHIGFLYACEKQVILYIDETFEVSFTNLALKILCTRDDYYFLQLPVNQQLSQ